MKKRRATGWGASALILALVLWATYGALDRQIALGGTGANRLSLQLLTLLLIILTLGLAGVLIRNLVRLIVDRKRGILGSRLRTKLVFFFLALVLLPAIALFVGSVKLIKASGEAILLSRYPVEDLIQESREIVDRWSDFFQDQCLSEARAFAAELARAGPLVERSAAELERALDRRRREAGIGLLWVVSQDGTIRRSTPTEDGRPPETEAELEQRVLERSRQAASRGQPVRGLDRLGEGLLAQAAVGVAGRPGEVVVAGIVLPSRISATWRDIDAANQAYRQFRIDRRELVRLYLTLIGLVFVATLFVATWIGFYVSRRITVPIQDLAAASREISAGNLEVRVRTQVGDELGTLVDTFNEMASELEENREVITRSTADLRRSNRALEERRRYIETLVANLSTAVISLDSDGVVTTANPAVQRILGIGLAPGDDARAILRRDRFEALRDAVDQAMTARGESFRHDLELPGNGGTRRISVQVSPLVGGASEDLGTLIMVEDLTELVRAQKALAWHEVALRIAHEIKNPLTPIQLAAQRLRKRFFEKAPDLEQVLEDATASIEREVGGLKRLVDEFSRYARMPEVVPKPVEFSRVVESVLALYRSHPGVRWEVELDPSPERVNADPEQMRRAMINLIDNAVAAMNGQGTIRVKTSHRPREGRLRIEISDSGPGIPLADRDKMFTPYFSTKKRGTGLGLAIVHKVVTDHEGTIRVEDNPPRGARFVIEIPA